MEDVAVPVLIENAEAGSFLDGEIPGAEVIVRFAIRHFLLGEGDVVVTVEVSVMRRYPREAPTHALLEGLYLAQRRTGNGHQRHVALGQVYQARIHVFCRHGAAWAPFRPFRTEHEVVNRSTGCARRKDQATSACRPGHRTRNSCRPSPTAVRAAAG